MNGAWIVGAAAGSVLGAAYFAGLRATLGRLPGTRRPTVLALLSYAARTGAVGLGFWAVASAGPSGIVAALAGFLGARHVALRRAVGDAGSGPPDGGPPGDRDRRT